MFNGVPAFNLRGSGVVGAWGVVVAVFAGGSSEGTIVIPGWMVGVLMGVKTGDCMAELPPGVLEGEAGRVGCVGRIST
jgi:hypothetical protein